ncbi:NUDIX domain-containing protein [Streptomyces longispororuber]|uniref:NUDIX domain-containing protein n=1 Tax=Streptomyces longispororuber TaxID=68230 RepID=UPI00210D9C15|nr:NUDIX domain-containing protein [Streptomyces longispororuber]MCQ4213877.1 NUDIX domain-containing protein [Streptomyces longispororuber]
MPWRPCPASTRPLSGPIEPGEEQQDTLVREVDEEVGLRVTPVDKVWESPSGDGGYVLHRWTAACPAESSRSTRERSARPAG